jgi:hypothetical protein
VSGAKVLGIVPRAVASTLLTRGWLLVPRELSWTRAHRLARLGLVTVDPHYHRWLGRADITDAGRLRLGAAA